MKKQNGFTLVELAIALMVIGLLIGGVLKGQELIANTRITQAVRDIEAIDTATVLFQNTYGDLPGDILNPGSRITGCATNTVCNRSGNRNGIVFNSSGTATHEQINFFCHMGTAGLLSNAIAPTPCVAASATANYAQFPALGGLTRIIFAAPAGEALAEAAALAHATARHSYIIGEKRQLRISAVTASMIDEKIDDGFPTTGRVRLAYNIVSACATSATPPEYNLDVSGMACDLLVAAMGTEAQ